MTFISGSIPWNKGKKLDIDIKRQISETISESFKSGERKPWNKGKSWDEKTKSKISATRKGVTAWNKGKSWDKITIEKISKSQKERYASLNESTI